MSPLRSTGRGSEAEHPEFAGQYRLESCLGSGGMGVVHLATSASGLRLAVKVVYPEFAADPEFRARFRQEVSAARRVSGAFTAPVVDADPDAEHPWMATLFIPGPTLAERVKRNGPLGLDELRGLGAGLSEALRDIHRAGVVHRDLKPSNVLLAADGPKVIDFGISRPFDSDLRTETGKVIGSPPFMAPEQFQRPREVGPAADVFAMGAVLAHAAMGRGPFDSDSPYIVAYQVVHNEPSLAGVPDALAPLIARCLAKDPADRPSPDRLAREFRGDSTVLSAGSGGLPSFQEQVGFEEPVGSGGGAFIPAQRQGNAASGPVGVGVGFGFGREDSVPPSTTDDRAADRDTDRDTAGRPGEPARPGRRGRLGVIAGALVLALGVGAAVVMASGGTDSAGPGGGEGAGRQAGGKAPFRPWSVALGSRDGASGGGSGAGGRPVPLCTGTPTALYCSAPGVLAARIDPWTGRTLWSEETEKTAGAQGAAGTGGAAGADAGAGVPEGADGAPVVSGGLLHVVEPGAQRLRALDPRTGHERWDVGLAPYATVRHIADAVLLVKTDGTVRVLDGRTGNERWTRPVGGPGTQWAAAGGDGPLFAVTPGADGLSSTVEAVDPDNGDVLWSTAADGQLDPVGTSDGALYLLASNSDLLTDAVVRVDIARRAPVRIPFGERIDQAQATVRAGTVYVVGATGSLLAVDARRPAASGGDAVRWRLETSVSRASRPTAAAGGRLYLSAADGRLIAVDTGRGRVMGQTGLRPGPDGSTVLAELPAPVAVSGKIFSGAPDGTLFAVDGRTPARW